MLCKCITVYVHILYSEFGVRGDHAGLPVERFGVQIPAGTEIWLEISAPLVSLVNSATMSTLAAHCR